MTKDRHSGAQEASTEEIDVLLTAQLAVAWAGEGGEEPRLNWWKSDLVSEFGGEDLFQRLLPQTWKWATLQAAREAARRRDAEARSKYHDPDQIISLYNLGFEIDERVDERLQDLKRATESPQAALPDLAKIITEDWKSDAFRSWLESHGTADFKTEPVGRRVKGAPPPQLAELTGQLLAALTAPADAYPLPFFRRDG